MTTSNSIKNISRSYTYAVKSAMTGRFVIKSKAAPAHAPKNPVNSSRTIQILETRANRLRSRSI